MGSFSVSLWVRGGNEEIVHVDNEPSFCDHITEGVIHELLECGRGVIKSKEHNGRFKKSFVHDEGSFPLVAILDVDIIISPTNIKFSEVASVFQLVHEVGDERERVGIMSGMFIEISVILAGVEFAILLFNKEERGCLGGIRRSNLSSSKVLFEEVLHGFLFIQG